MEVEWHTNENKMFDQRAVQIKSVKAVINSKPNCKFID